MKNHFLDMTLQALHETPELRAIVEVPVVAEPINPELGLGCDSCLFRACDASVGPCFRCHPTTDPNKWGSNWQPKNEVKS